MHSTIRIIARKSMLAQTQARQVKEALESLYPKLTFILLGCDTEGDQHLEYALSKIGGKGLFVKALEDCLIHHQADIAVHSLKDMPMILPDTLCIGAILPREDPRDVLISNIYKTLNQIPATARIGTSSVRRKGQLQRLYPQLQVHDLRGNVDSRLKKLEVGEYQALILASAGLKRLGLIQKITQYLPIPDFLPAIGQGALALECRRNDIATQSLLSALNHQPTADCVYAERQMNQRLDGGCQLPIAGYATFLNNGALSLQGMILSPDGTQCIQAHYACLSRNPIRVGNTVADALLRQGAQHLLALSRI